jgi:hypothetical protein
VHRQANAARRVERLDVPRTPVRHRLLDLRLAHQHLHLGAQFATDQRDQIEGRLARRNVEQAAGVTVDVANFELAVDQDAGRDEMTPGRLEQDVLETQWGGRLGPLMLVETGGRRLHLGAQQRQAGTDPVPAVQAAVLVDDAEQRFLLENALGLAEEQVSRPG